MKSKVVAHVLGCGLLTTITGIFPGSICAMVVIAGFAAMYFWGQSSTQKEGQESEPPLLFIAYLTCGFLGALANVAFLLFVGRGR